MQYYNGYVFTWKQGRRLDTVKDGNTTIASYKYNDDGIRTSKTTQWSEYKYILNGTQIVAEMWDDCINIYLYDEYGSPIGFLHRYANMAQDTYRAYFFEKNMFGDILAIYDINGVKQVSYTYDAFGNSTRTIHVSGTRADFNRLRYRGYYYDAETGFYYLNSRYYDPVTCRFINADSPFITTATPMSLTDKNLFAYCDNNPVMREDNSGYFWDIVFDIASLVSSVVEVVVNPYDPWNWVGLAGDIVDVAVPFVSGVGEVTKAVSTGFDVADTLHDAKKVADNLGEVAETTEKIIKAKKTSERASAVRKAWKNEFENVVSGGRGISRQWTDIEIEELICTGKVKGYQGHHMKSVKGYPSLAGDPQNIQFLTRREHLKAHGGNWRNITHERYIV